jgi:hypothetical protein
MVFTKHPSTELVTLFNNQPYQGQSPEYAKLIFLSSDANYSAKIYNHQFFKYILEYQEDGVAFWKKHGCHHPFLLDDYPFDKTRGGRPFHKNFSKLGLNIDHAPYVSFLELLDIPTIGNKSQNRNLFFSLINENHLKYIDNLICETNGKIFFVSSGVLKDMLSLKKEFNVFNWLNVSSPKNTKLQKHVNGNLVKEIYHFSSSHIHTQIEEIRKLIDIWLKL